MARILITGGSGFLGRALTRTCLALGHTVCVFSRSEARQAEFAAALGPQPNVRFFLGDVRNEERLLDAMWRCDAVVGAAANKRVDTVAFNPIETRLTNIEGSANTTRAAARAGVPRVLLISTDKGTEAHNYYGVTKAAMEFEAIASNAIYRPHGTRVACTRYGNVLSSTGSVLSVWAAAVERGEPIPITDPDATRFWLTAETACAVILAALDRMDGGEVFVPVLPAMRLGDLAEAVAPGWPMRVIGMREGGEKKHELLLNADEVRRTVALNEHLYLVKPAMHPWCAEEPAAWDGEPVPPEFCYRSDLVGWRLSVADMRKMLEAIP